MTFPTRSERFAAMVTSEPTFPLSAYTGRWQGPTLTPTAYEVTINGHTFWTPVKPTWTLGLISFYRNELRTYPKDTIVLCEKACSGLHTTVWIGKAELEAAGGTIPCHRCGGPCKEVKL